MMDGETIGAGAADKVVRDIGFQVTPSWRAADRQKVQHEFGDGVGRSLLRRLHMGRVEGGGDVVAVAVLGTEGVSEAVEVKPVAEESLQHGHAVGAAVLKHDDRDAGR